MKSKTSWVSILLICFILLCINYINKNLDNIYLLQAKYHLRKENLSTAQEYLEKAFELGLEDSEYRDVYVSSLINSPLTLESQKKLIKFLEYPIEDNARLKVEYFLYDLKREIHKKYLDNYISQAVFNNKIIRWNTLPITYSFITTSEIPKYFIREIENALTQWEELTEHQIIFAEDDNNPNIIIRFNAHNPADNEDQKYIVAYTVPTITENKLKNMTINFYLKDPNEEFFNENQVYNTALHEIVHALGFMGHSNNKSNIMYLTKDSMSIINNLREIPSDGDINTVKLLYKIKPDITNTKPAKGEYLPYFVLGNEQEISNAKIKEAKIYIKKAPNLPNGYMDLAESYVASKEYPKAIKNLEKALQLADNEEIIGMIYYNLAVSYYYIANYELAEDYLKKSMKIKDSDEQHFLLAEIYSKQKYYEKAIIEYRNLYKKSPKNVEYAISLINAYVNKKQYFKARSILKQFYIKNPNEKNNPKLNAYGILNFGL